MLLTHTVNRGIARLKFVHRSPKNYSLGSRVGNTQLVPPDVAARDTRARRNGTKAGMKLRYAFLRTGSFLRSPTLFLGRAVPLEYELQAQLHIASAT
jgi:hypothetical protein